jgi:UDP-N-acetylglucosamine--N-acetylmuramyl-(pentapeptide) pyrophosphoryl-undecaprenol N-acetylglucosamine transferase
VPDKHIVIMAGGTGGHVFPALAVARELLAQGCSISWMGTEKGLESRVVPNAGIAIDWLAVSGVRGMGIWAKIKAPWMLLDACRQALRILRQRRPAAVLGMGGFVSGPGALMAKLLGIPLVIHEQNSIPGTTNRWLCRIADRVLQGFPNCFAAKTGAIVTGNPLRESFRDARFCVSTKPAWHGERKLRILVVGGSQGAQALNETVPQALAELPGVEVKHQTGAAMLDAVRNAYRKYGVDAEATAFIDDMAAAYLWADLAICRAGAMTVSELAAAGLPGILIPFPYAIDDHQTANARHLVDCGAALLIPQTQMTVERLNAAVGEVKQQIAGMSAAARTFARLDATEQVAGYCIREAER